MPTLSSAFGTLQQSRPLYAGGAIPGAVDPAVVPTALADALRAMDLLATADLPRARATETDRTTRAIPVQVAWGTVCVKRAEADWRAAREPLGAARCAAEVRWLRVAQSIAPGCAPAVLGECARVGVFAMEYLAPEEFPTWQSRLASGLVEPWVAAEVGHLLGRLHAATAHSAAVGAQFQSREAFLALRVAPVFGGGVAARPDCAWDLRRREAAVATARTALVHGDFGPDNVLVGPRGPVLVDADCAHYGDPMVDVATLLAALLVRMAGHTQHRGELAACWDAFQRSYFAHATWEMPEHAEARAAGLVPAFALAALAGPSGAVLRASGRGPDALAALLLAAPKRLDGIREAWLESVGEC